MIIHQGTQIVSHFSKVDENGNVIETYVVAPQENKPDPLQIRIFNQQSFIEAYNAILKIKEQLEVKNANCNSAEN